MKNIIYIYHFPTCYTYSVRKPIYRELNLVRALDEDTGPGAFSFLSSSAPLGQTAVSGNSNPSSVTLRIFDLTLLLILGSLC